MRNLEIKKLKQKRENKTIEKKQERYDDNKITQSKKKTITKQKRNKSY